MSAALKERAYELLIHEAEVAVLSAAQFYGYCNRRTETIERVREHLKKVQSALDEYDACVRLKETGE